MQAENMTAECPGNSNAEKWFAVRVRSRAEKTVATIAHQRGLTELLPIYECRRRWSDRVKVVELPLFPGYVFCRLDPTDRLPLLTIPGVLHIVGGGRVPIPVDDDEISAIRAAATSGLPAEPWPCVKIGERLRLDSGPLAGVEGLLVDIRKSYRLILSVTLLNRSIAVEIDRDWVKSSAPIQFKAFQPAASPCLVGHNL